VEYPRRSDGCSLTARIAVSLNAVSMLEQYMPEAKNEGWLSRTSRCYDFFDEWLGNIIIVTIQSSGVVFSPGDECVEVLNGNIIFELRW
jgi:hypothetical protein